MVKKKWGGEGTCLRKKSPRRWGAEREERNLSEEEVDLGGGAAGGVAHPRGVPELRQDPPLQRQGRLVSVRHQGD